MRTSYHKRTISFTLPHITRTDYSYLNYLHTFGIYFHFSTIVDSQHTHHYPIVVTATLCHHHVFTLRISRRHYAVWHACRCHQRRVDTTHLTYHGINPRSTTTLCRTLPSRQTFAVGSRALTYYQLKTLIFAPRAKLASHYVERRTSTFLKEADLPI